MCQDAFGFPNRASTSSRKRIPTPEESLNERPTEGRVAQFPD